MNAQQIQKPHDFSGFGRHVRPERKALMTTELLVAAMLLVTVMSVVATLAVQSGRLWQGSQHYRIALDELTNQLDRLTSLEPEQLETALAELAPSAQASQALPDVALAAETVTDADGQRLILRIDWRRCGNTKPLELTAWINPLPSASSQVPKEESKP